jgi:hypothetical protein
MYIWFGGFRRKCIIYFCCFLLFILWSNPLVVGEMEIHGDRGNEHCVFA